MTTAVPLHYSFSEYVRFERDAHERHEFVRGLILAMAGGTLEHARLTAALIATLSAQLQGKRCAVLDSNARVRVLATGNAYYPDASVVCGTLQKDPEDEFSLVNPIVLVEVSSPSTEEYDRGEKLSDYQLVPSVQHIVHVAHDERRVEVWTRDRSSFRHHTYRTGDSASLGAIDVTLDVDALYRDPLA
jgi:Uma2 family endonuclease